MKALRECVSVFTLTVPRALRLRSEEETDLPMPVDEDGFLDEGVLVRNSIDSAEPGNLLSPAAAGEIPQLVILGEPGLGKSTLLDHLEATLGESGRTVVRIDGADLTEETCDRQFRAAQSDFVSATGREGSREASLIIDSLDESPVVLRFARRLRRWVEVADVSTFQLILGCRTADLPPDLVSTMRQLFDRPPLVADLAPLRRTDAVELATSAGVDGEDLVAAAVARGAGSMAAVPLTLELLVREYRVKGRLDASPRELFERGVSALLETTSPTPVSTADQRRAVAERVAATALLSGKRTIFVGRSADATEHDLRDSLVADGVERTIGSGEFSITPAHVKETIGTALFSGRGPDRVAFVHASQAAFLAACYLLRQEPPLPREQLRSLLLVAAPDGAESVPTSLREVAAWLASMSSSSGEWLARVDPESLVGHQSYLDSPQLRSLVVESLLDRAAEFDLGNRYWFRTLDLNHPTLSDQIVETLAPYERQPPDYRDFARCRVALRLARHAQSDELTDRLFEIAQSADWNAHLGSLAVDALLNVEGTAGGLRNLLRSLDDPDFTLVRDSDDEMRGHLLDGLWPGRIHLSDVLNSLLPRHGELIGSYWRFLREFPRRLTDSDIPEAMRWAARTAVRDGATTSARDATGFGERPVGQLDITLLTGLVERALQCKHPAELIRDAALLTWHRLDRYERPEMPEALDEHISGPTAHVLRRQFVEAMIRARAPGELGLPDIWHLATYWRTRQHSGEGREPARWNLLDSDDFFWAAERQHNLFDRDPSVASGLAEIAGVLFDAAQPDHVEVAWNARSTPLWEHVAHWFDAVDLDSPLADRLRKRSQLQLNQDLPDPDIGGQVVALRADLLDQYQRAVAGETDGFWRMARLLQFEPKSAQQHQPYATDQLFELPGAVALPANAKDVLTSVALTYLSEEHDHADEWLGSDHYDQRAWAGYLALALVDETRGLKQLPPEIWARWTGAIAWFWTSDSDERAADRKQRFLTCATTSDPARVATLLRRFVRGELRRGSSTAQIRHFPSPSVVDIQATWIDVTQEVRNALTAGHVLTDDDYVDDDETFRIPKSDDARRNARFTLEQLLERLIDAAPDAAEHLVLEWLRTADTTESTSIAAHATAQLIASHPTAWKRTFPIAQGSAERGRAIAMALSDDRRHAAVQSAADESELGGLYDWLAGAFPPEADPPDLFASGWGTPEAQTIRWRDGVLAELADRGTDRGLLLLAQLKDRHPTRTVVLSNFVRARIAIFGSAWTPPTPPDFLALVADHRRRLVRSATEVSELAVGALREMQQDLQRTGQLLWDQVAKRGETPRWRPKPEAALSAFIAHELRLRLVGRGLAVNQEVLVKPTDAKGSGDQPDILIEAISNGSPSHGPTTFRVAVEIKGAWHNEVLSAQNDQLAARYLSASGTDAGLYVVGWYPLDLWDSDDGPKRQAKKHENADALERRLQLQADRIRSEYSLYVWPVVLTIPRPFPNQ